MSQTIQGLRLEKFRGEIELETPLKAHNLPLNIVPVHVRYGPNQVINVGIRRGQFIYLL